MTQALVDYYALLGVARSASGPELEQAIKQGIRTWSKQTSRPELDKRQEAERRMQQLKEARETLLDEDRRRSYDQQLAAASAAGGPAGGTATAIPGAPADGEDWLALARSALSINDYRTAVRAAQEAQPVQQRTAEVWSIMARANAGLGRLDDAVFEAQRALQLDPNDLDHRYTLAAIFEQLGDWTNALQSYEALARLDPGSELPLLGTASVYLSSGDHARAVSLLEHLYTNGRDPRPAGDYLAMALQVAAERAPRVHDGDAYLITSPDEINYMRGLLERAQQVTKDPDLLADIAEVRGHVEHISGSHFFWRRLFGRWARRYAFAVVLLLCISGFAEGFRPLAVVAILAGAAGLVLYARVPRWKLNLVAHEDRYLTY